MQRNQLDSDQLALFQHQQSKSIALIYIGSQLIVTIVVSTILLFFDVVWSYSAFAGGLIASLTTAWFAYKVFRVSTNNSAETLLASAYIGEIYKIILTGALFICAFVMIKPLSAATLLLSYFVIYMTPAMVSLLGGRTVEQQTRIEDTERD